MGSKQKKKFLKSGKFNHRVAQQCKIARSLISNRKYKEAKELLDAALAMEPKDTFVLVALGDVSRFTKNFLASIEYYESCLKYDPTNRFALSGLGDAHRGNQDLNSAIAIWSKTISLYPDNFQVITRLADALTKIGDPDQAKELYKQALEINNLDPYALSGLGNLFARQRNFKDAQPLLEKLVEIQGDSPRALGLLANFYRKSNSYKKGLAIFQKILSINPYNTYALDGAADCARGLEDYPLATSMWTKAVEAGMDPVVANTRIADGFLKLGQLDKAKKLYNTVLKKTNYKYALLGKLRLLKKESLSKEKRLEKAALLFAKLFDLKSTDTRIAHEYNSFKTVYPDFASVCTPPE